MIVLINVTHRWDPKDTTKMGSLVWLGFMAYQPLQVIQC